MSIVFSKSFLSFTKSKNVAEDFYKRFNKNAMFTVKRSIQEKNFLAHADIEELSCFDYEKEVLFFPFCAFGINKLESYFDNVHQKYRYEIELKYLGEYKDIYNSIEDKEESLPDTDFKRFFEKSGLAKEDIKNAKIKNLSEEEEIKKEKSSKKKYIIIFVIVGVILVGVIVVISNVAKTKSSKTTNSTKVVSNLNSYTENHCDSGYNLEKDTKICTICPEGTYSQKGAKECSKCPNGTYSNVKGASKCSPYHNNTYTDERSATE